MFESESSNLVFTSSRQDPARIYIVDTCQLVWILPIRVEMEKLHESETPRSHANHHVVTRVNSFLDTTVPRRNGEVT